LPEEVHIMSLRSRASLSVAVVAALVVGSIALVPTSASAAALSPTWVRSYAAAGASGVAATADRIYVSTTTGISTINRTTNVVSTFATGSGFQNLALDTQGNIWATVGSASVNVVKFSPQGVRLAQLSVATESNQLIGIDFGPDGNLYLNDADYLYVVTPTGQPVATWGAAGANDLYDPYQISFDGKGRAYVAEYRQGRVSVLDESTGVRQFSVAATSPGSVAPLPYNDNFLVGATGGLRQYSSAGTVLSTYGTAGSGTAQFGNALMQIATFGDHVFVADRSTSRLIELVYGEIPRITTTAVPAAQVGVAYSQQLDATGFETPTFAVTAGILPAGISLTRTGLLSGTPTQAGTFSITVTATNATGSNSRSFSVTVALGTLSAGPDATITGTPRPGSDLTASAASVDPTATLSYQWLLSGQNIAGATTETLRLTDAMVGRPVTVRITASKPSYTPLSDTSDAVTVLPSLPTITTPAGALPSGTYDTDYSTTLEASGTAPLEWSVLSGALPSGLTLSTAGVLSGAPTALGEFSFTAEVENSNGDTDSRGYSITVGQNVFSADVEAGITGDAIVGEQLTATANTLTPAPSLAYRWLLDGDVISGETSSTLELTEDMIGSSVTVQITATRTGYETSIDASSPVGPVLPVAPTITTTNLPDGTVDAAYSTTLTASGVPAPTFEITSGELPDGLTLSADGVLSGTPTENGDFTIEVTASNGLDATTTLTLHVGKAHFTTDVAVTLSGEARVGARLDAVVTAITPAPDALAYQWLADGTPIPGATSASFTVPASLASAAISVRVTAVRVGYVDSVGTSVPTAPIATDPAPIVDIEEGLPAASFAVHAKKRGVIGEKTVVRASGLAAGESYTVRIGSKKVATGVASAAGTFSAKVGIPKKVHAGERTVSVTGDEKDRVGTDTIELSKLKHLKLVIKKKWVRASDENTLTVQHLLPKERVTIVYNGERITPKKARANVKGVYRFTFGVDVFWGWRTIEVRGHHDDRTETVRMAVSPYIG
jgi:hypothetical protein